LRTGAVDGLVAAFSFNHLHDPASGFREARRVCRTGSPVLVAAYAADDDHPVKAAAEQALVEAGWARSPGTTTCGPTPSPGWRRSTACGPRLGPAASTATPIGWWCRSPTCHPPTSWPGASAWPPPPPSWPPSPPTAQSALHTRALDLLVTTATPPPLHRSLILFTASVP
jgi:hypothetical protein